MNSHHISFPLLSGRLIMAWVLLSALAFDPGGFAPFGPVKWFAVSALIPLGLAAAGTSALVIEKRTTLVWAGVLGWVGLAAMLGVDRFHAWLGTPDRRFGFWAWLLCAAAFVLGQQLINLGALRSLYRAAVLVGIGIGSYGLIELGGWAPVDLGFSETRLGSTYGSPAYLGAACALLIPMVVSFALSETGTWRRLGWLSSAGLTFAVLGSGTRGAWVGLALAAGIVGFAQRSRLTPHWRYGVLAAAALALIAIATPVGGRIKDGFHFTEGTTAGRMAEWQVGLDAVAQRPFSGSGPEGYRVVFADSVTESYAQEYGRTAIVDRAHNGLIDIAVTTGVPGLGLIVVLFYLLARPVWLAISSGDVLAIGAGAGLMGYFGQQMFLFPLAELDPMAWLVAGWIVIRAAKPPNLAEGVNLPRIGLAALVVLGVVGAALGVLEVGADHAARQALDKVQEGDFDGALDSADAAAMARPDSIRYAAVGAEVNRLIGTVAAMNAALESNERGLRYSPEDPGLKAGRGALLLTKSRIDPSEETLSQALAAWESLAAEDPNNGRYQLQLGVAQIQVGNWSAAREAWLRSAYLSPGALEPLINLGLGYLGVGNIDQAREFLALAQAIDATDSGVEALAQKISDQS